MSGSASAPSSTRTRSVAIDGVRALGIVAVVAGHTWPNDAWVSNWLFSWHVPVFFVVSGYLWNSGRGISEELRKRTRTLVVPYVAWFLLVAAVWFTARALRGESLSSEPPLDLLLGGDHISRPWSAFWFISALFIAAVATRVLETWSPILPWFVGGLAVAWCYAAPDSARALPYAAVQGAVGMLFLCAGRLLRRAADHVNNGLLTGLVLIVLPMALVVVDVLPSMNMKAANLGEPIVTMLTAFAVSWGLVLVAQATEHMWPAALRRVVIVTAQLGLPIILGHALVLGLLALFGVPPTWASFALALLLPASIGWLLGRAKWGQFFL